jgi:hypothetical protein
LSNFHDVDGVVVGWAGKKWITQAVGADGVAGLLLAVAMGSRARSVPKLAGSWPSTSGFVIGALADDDAGTDHVELIL